MFVQFVVHLKDKQKDVYVEIKHSAWDDEILRNTLSVRVCSVLAKRLLVVLVWDDEILRNALSVRVCSVLAKRLLF